MSAPPTNAGQSFPPEPLTATEAKALLHAPSTRAPTGLRNRALIACLYGAGLRLAEALALKPADVDLDAGQIRVLHGKGDVARTAGIDAGALVHVARWADYRRTLGFRNGPLLCTLDGKPLSPRYVRAMLTRMAARAGIDKRVHPHGLRHTHAAELEQGGFTVTEIQGQLGHANLATTAVYLNHISPSARVAKIHNRRAELWSAVPDTSRAAALSAAVALTTAALGDVEVDRDALLDGLTDRQVADAAVWLARMLTDNALHDTGPLMLRVVGQVAGWVDSGGPNASWEALYARLPLRPVHWPSPTAVRAGAAALAGRAMTSAAVLVGGVLCVPPELLAELHAELQAPRQAVPLNVTTPRRTPQIAELVDLVRDGAIAHRQRTRETLRAFPALSQPSSAPSLAVSAPAGGLSMGESGEVVGVAVASGMLGFSPQWVRVLAASGQLPGSRKTRGIGNGGGPARARWCIPLVAVHAYLQTREVAR